MVIHSSQLHQLQIMSQDLLHNTHILNYIVLVIFLHVFLFDVILEMTTLSYFFQVLKFNAWYKQTVHESPNEHYRVRHVNIYYYLEDDSISVVEPVIENSGMPQGEEIKIS